MQLTGIAFIVHLVSHLAAVSIDPAEAGVRAKKSYSNPLPVFDKKKQPHVIHNLHCYLCKINVYVSHTSLVKKGNLELVKCFHSLLKVAAGHLVLV